MAEIFNNQRVLGIQLVDDGEVIHNNQPVIGIREVDGGVLFSDNQPVLGVDILSDPSGTIHNDQPIIGAVVIDDDRVMYNNRRVVPVSVLSGSIWTPAELFSDGADGLWLDGGDPAKVYGPDEVPGAYQDDAGTTPVTEAGQFGGLVISLDQGAEVSGGVILGNHAVQATAGNRPELGYDGTLNRYFWLPDGDDYWEVDGSVGELPGDFEIHAAVRWVNNRCIVSKLDEGYSDTGMPAGWMLFSSSGGAPTLLWRPVADSTATLAGDSIANDADVVVSVYRDDGTIYIAVDGEVQGSSNVPSAGDPFGSFSSPVQIFRRWAGSNGFGAYWNNRLYGEGLVLINNGLLSGDDRAKLVRYLAKLQGRVL